jgi:hypothetical protein
MSRKILLSVVSTVRASNPTNAFSIGFVSGVFDVTYAKLRGLSPQANYTDRATAAVGEVVPTFASRECYVVSATDSHGR